MLNPRAEEKMQLIKKEQETIQRHKEAIRLILNLIDDLGKKHTMYQSLFEPNLFSFVEILKLYTEQSEMYISDYLGVADKKEVKKFQDEFLKRIQELYKVR